MASWWHTFLLTPSHFQLALLLISVVAGMIGAILGLGGGIVIVPALTLLFGVNIRYAIGASIVAVIATSSGAAATYVRDHITNIRVAMLLEVATTLGALAGAVLSTHAPTRALFLVFGLVLIISAFMMTRARQSEGITQSDKWATRLKLASSYPDPALGREVAYGVAGVPIAFGVMWDPLESTCRHASLSIL